MGQQEKLGWDATEPGHSQSGAMHNLSCPTLSQKGVDVCVCIHQCLVGAWPWGGYVLGRGTESIS